MRSEKRLNPAKWPACTSSLSSTRRPNRSLDSARSGLFHPFRRFIRHRRVARGHRTRRPGPSRLRRRSGSVALGLGARAVTRARADRPGRPGSALSQPLSGRQLRRDARAGGVGHRRLGHRHRDRDDPRADVRAAQPALPRLAAGGGRPLVDPGRETPDPTSRAITDRFGRADPHRRRRAGRLGPGPADDARP